MRGAEVWMLISLLTTRQASVCILQCGKVCGNAHKVMCVKPVLHMPVMRLQVSMSLVGACHSGSIQMSRRYAYHPVTSFMRACNCVVACIFAPGEKCVVAFVPALTNSRLINLFLM